jgi:hypothetical protein
MKRLSLILLALSALGSLQGCKGLMEFNVPKEFQGQKVKEDPPGTLLPEPLRPKAAKEIAEC